jgi:hypothetical protein
MAKATTAKKMSEPAAGKSPEVERLEAELNAATNRANYVTSQYEKEQQFRETQILMTAMPHMPQIFTGSAADCGSQCAEFVRAYRAKLAEPVQLPPAPSEAQTPESPAVEQPEPGNS